MGAVRAALRTVISKLTPRYPTAANTNECLFHRPVGLILPMSVNIDIRKKGGSPIVTASRMSVYFTDTGIIINVIFGWHHLFVAPRVGLICLMRVSLFQGSP